MLLLGSTLVKSNREEKAEALDLPRSFKKQGVALSWPLGPIMPCKSPGRRMEVETLMARACACVFLGEEKKFGASGSDGWWGSRLEHWDRGNCQGASSRSQGGS